VGYKGILDREGSSWLTKGVRRMKRVLTRRPLRDKESIGLR